MSVGGSSLFAFQRDHMKAQKAMSLPSSPHDYGSPTPVRSGTSDYGTNEELLSTWNRILRSPMFQNRPLLPFDEWNIDFSELTVGTRVGIGNCLTILINLLHLCYIPHNIHPNEASCIVVNLYLTL